MSGPAKALRDAFVEDYYRFATPEDVPASAAARQALALSQLAWGNRRKRGQIRVRVFNPVEAAHCTQGAHTAIETITDDSPFIVDSLTMRLNAVSQGVHVKLHAIIRVERNEQGDITACHPKQDGLRESWTHFEIPRVVDAKELVEIERQLKSTLEDVRRSVRDWPRMVDRLHLAAQDLRRFGKGKELAESAQLLDWLADDHFTLLGYAALTPTGSSSTRMALGLLRSSERRAHLHRVENNRQSAREPLTITKSTIRSTVHRPALLDDIRIDAFDADGEFCGEHRFVGLFTSGAYNENPRDIPLLRAKVERVLRRSGLDPKGHRGKSLRHILDTYPRDELIQSGVDELERIAVGILNIEERRKVRLFCSRSPYGDFLSCFVYLPRDSYSARTRERIERFLEKELDGRLVDSQLTISESTLARLSVTLQRKQRASPMPDIDALQPKLEKVAASWLDRARGALLESFSEERALALHHRFAAGFPVQYQESMQGPRIGQDFEAVEALVDNRAQERFRLVPAERSRATFTAILPDSAVPLYLANPILENLGVKLLQETSHQVDADGSLIFIQDFFVEATHGEPLDADGLAKRFEECFASALAGQLENDSFNQLVVAAGLEWRQVVVLRAYCKYLLQCRAQFSRRYMVETLRRHPRIVAGFIELFAAYFDPSLSQAEREERVPSRAALIRKELDRAGSLDEDRILKMFAGAIQGSLRTNFYQRDEDGGPKPWLSIKLDPSRIPEVPVPRPKYEIFVYSTDVEGVHLRCGDIARGGIRWSDRREDFRTEVLGLMKAQQVKNTVIVPVGAKGGFVLKNPPEGDRAALQKHAIACYRTFLRGLLDLTDNIDGNRTITPASTICRDGSDPYLVVAADKGTATFSDTANAVAAEYGFWLGDAFASGGSAGYDHKKMGITARGAWESVKRHFREMGVDCQSEAFTAVGIGDMSGDVFGNGMLLSHETRLVAAFNHRHIFIDPNPDPAVSFAERQRLFALTRSGWDDYDKARISKGGGVFDRQSKSIELEPEAQAVLGIEQSELTPPELIRAVLLAPVDLVFNGGIGTYVKASTESHADAADPGNDAVRVDGKSLRARIVAEGGNLGLTQRGRIEYALAGGRLNTDFIDNSAGVDTSDREVNIKILLADAISRGSLAAGRRNRLLASMTDEISDLVLADNYAQTQALSMMVSTAHERLGEHAQLIRTLESRGLLNRALEFLPGEDEIEERRRAGLGFTRPELAVILSYAKIELYESLIATDIPDEAHCQAEVSAYFPARLSKRFDKSVHSHRLRREIAAMQVSSSMINRMGPFFALRAEEDTGTDTAEVARAYAVVRTLFDTRGLWREIEALDGELQTQVQYDCFFESSRMIRRAAYWFLHRRRSRRNIAKIVAAKQTEIDAVLADLPGLLCGWSKRSYERDAQSFESLGVPRKLGERIASLPLLTQVLDIAELASELSIAPRTVARLHFELGRGLRLDWIREQVEQLHVEGHWRAMARSTLRETLGREQRGLLNAVLKRARNKDYSAALADWLTEKNTSIARLKRTLDEMQAGGSMDFATLSIALKEIGRLR